MTLFGLATLYYIGQQFPHQVEEEYPDLILQGLGAPIRRHRELNAVMLLDLFRQPFDGRLKTQFVEYGRAEFTDQRPDGADGLPEELPDFIQ